MIHSGVDAVSNQSMSGVTRMKDHSRISRHLFATTPRMQMVWDVLEAAKDNRDEMAVAVCRRLIVADRLGWKKHADREDIRLVMSLAN